MSLAMNAINKQLHEVDFIMFKQLRVSVFIGGYTNQCLLPTYSKYSRVMSSLDDPHVPQFFRIMTKKLSEIRITGEFRFRGTILHTNVLQGVQIRQNLSPISDLRGFPNYEVSELSGLYCICMHPNHNRISGLAVVVVPAEEEEEHIGQRTTRHQNNSCSMQKKLL